MRLPRLLAALSPWRWTVQCGGGLCEIDREGVTWWRARRLICWRPGCHAWVRRDVAPWVLWLGRWSWLIVTLVALAVAAVLPPRAEAQEWRGSMEWRGERVELVSCCGPMREPVVRRELEAGYARARADLDASGHQHVALPPLGTPEAPYTIEIARDPGCPGGAQGCSRTVHPEQRWTLAVMRDKATKRAAPVDHEIFHRWFLLVRPIVVPPRSLAEVLALPKLGMLADHGAGKGYRYDVAGRVVPVRKGKP